MKEKLLFYVCLVVTGVLAKGSAVFALQLFR